MAILRVRDNDGNITDIPAIKGGKGDKGDPGKSAYETARTAGYTGTEAELAVKLNSIPVIIYGTEPITAGSASSEPEGALHFVIE